MIGNLRRQDFMLELIDHTPRVFVPGPDEVFKQRKVRVVDSRRFPQAILCGEEGFITKTFVSGDERAFEVYLYNGTTLRDVKESEIKLL